MTTKTSDATVVTIKFEQLAKQTAGGITRYSGFVKGRHFIAIIDNLDLEANPRTARVGRVTNAIIESIKTTPKEFPFKTKGVLLGATQFEELDRGRIRATFVERDKEGILDGGHNTMAIGLHTLRVVDVPETKVRRARDWATFRKLWGTEQETVKQFRGELSAFGHQEPSDDDDLGFLIPVELIVPNDPDDIASVHDFQSSILEICAARNNNAELAAAGKANQSGLFEDLKSLVPESIAQRIEWKPGEGGAVKVADLIALSWIPLSILEPMPTDPGTKAIVPPIPQNLYQHKAECLTKFDDLMRLDAVTKDAHGTFELHNPRVFSALKVAATMPEVFDLIEELFPDAYNKAEGNYGRISAVKKLNGTKAGKKSHFEGRTIPTLSPDGFLYPLVYGTRELMTRTNDGMIEWVTDPVEFIKANIVQIVDQYRAVITALKWEPQPVGKTKLAYDMVSIAFKAALDTWDK